MTGHERNDIDSFGLHGWDSFDDGNISLGDSSALVGLFSDGGGNMSPLAYSTTMPTSNGVQSNDPPLPPESMNRKPRSIKRINGIETKRAVTKRRKG